ncbi:uncharacterized protein LOC128557088 [Mercenaria mercenaria]|uniref:uncharacterized protein LOC128557088 n=1 Tax=Mercenaria mercenaria TaxID=6596 RepID=UPI00234ED292|nr:uncharacterized protein LOC128557088 [Mercenaria mercenaria]
MEIQKFVKECFEICWLMVIQDPPLVFASRSKGELLNTELYKPYTKNGKYVKFIVWPAMLLHKDGPVLAKGVAQGERGNQDKDKLAIDYVDKLNFETHLPHTEWKFDKHTYTIGHFAGTSRNVDYSNGPLYKEYKGQSFERKISAEMGKERHQRAKSEGEKRFEQPALTKLSSSGTKLIWKPYKEYERHPTPDEMRTYFYYFDRREYSKAKDVLGSKVYFRCMQNEHKRHMYSTKLK